MHESRPATTTIRPLVCTCFSGSSRSSRPPWPCRDALVGRPAGILRAGQARDIGGWVAEKRDRRPLSRQLGQTGRGCHRQTLLEKISADLPEEGCQEFIDTLQDRNVGVARVARIVSYLRGFTAIASWPSTVA